MISFYTKANKVSGSIFLLVLAQLFMVKPTLAQDTTKIRAKYVDLDLMLARPLENQIITDSAYEAILYEKQVTLTGLAVQTSKTLGASVTADDQGAGINVGLVSFHPFGFLKDGDNTKRLARLNIAPIVTARFASDEGFAAVFSGNTFQKNFSYGGSILLFGSGRSMFKEREKKDLHWKLSQLRAEDEKAWSGPLVPYNRKKWQELYKQQKANDLAQFVLTWNAFQKWLKTDYTKNSLAYRFYKGNGDLTQAELNDAMGEKRYRTYLDAEHKALPMLGEDWDGLERLGEQAFVREIVNDDVLKTLPDTTTFSANDVTNLVNIIKATPKFNSLLEKAREKATFDVLTNRFAVYDSLQQHVKWVQKVQFWGTVSAVGNVATQPIFNAANQQKTFADEYTDKYIQVQGAANFLVDGDNTSFFLSAGSGWSNGLVFKKDNLVTYQTTSQQVVGTNTVVTVEQKQLYPELPTYMGLWHAQAQLTFAFHRAIGLTANYDGQFARTTHGIHALTMGIFVPVKAAASTLILTPLVRARSIDLPHRWSYGFGITASIPGFSAH